MKTADYRLVEHEGGYIIYQGEEVYETKLYTNIFVYDKGLGDAIVRKMNEGKPLVVQRYLRKFNKAELVEMIRQLMKRDPYSPYQIADMCDAILEEPSIRRIIDAYTEIGTFELLERFCFFDAYEDDDYEYDPFLSYYGIDAYDNMDYIYESFEEQLLDCGREVEIDRKYAKMLTQKYDAFIIPKSPGRKAKYLKLRDKYFDE